MAEPFKNLINAQTMREVGHHLQRAWPAFDRKAFEKLAIAGLAELEFKARATHLGQALHATLPADFAQAADILQRSLKPVPPPSPDHDPDKELGQLKTDDTGLAGWALWGFGEFTARHGQAHPARALALLHAITQRFTAEFAIRPFIVAHPELALSTLAIWTQDPSAHVRRLASEGSRPRLPWGLRLHSLVQDPGPTLPLLRQLQDDPSEYVRRSVANHLNDIGKDHPELLMTWLAEHLPQASPARMRLLRHACRSLIKQGHPGILNAWGLGQAFEGEVKLRLDKKRVAIGEALVLQVTLQSHSTAEQTIELDYRVHHLKANGETSAKTFKGKRIVLAPGGKLVWAKQHAFKVVTTRRYHPGRHQLDVQLNGQAHGLTAFELLPGKA